MALSDGAGGAAAPRRTVLVVDDSATDRKLAARMIEVRPRAHTSRIGAVRREDLFFYGVVAPRLALGQLPSAAGA